MKLRKKFKWNKGRLFIHIQDWSDGTPLGYVWFGTQKRTGELPSYDFNLQPTQAVTLAKNILIAAKVAKLSVKQIKRRIKNA